MIKLTLLILVLTIISTSYLQEIPETLPDPLLTSDQNSPLWTLQNLPQRRKGKPCPRRSNRGDEPWIPSYSSKIIHPLHEPTVLQPQALKNEEVENKNVYKDDNNEDDSLNRRSYDLTTHSVQPFNPNDYDDDCVEQLGATKGDAEDTALKIIEDCLKKKQKSKVEQTLLGSSRRSMPANIEYDEDTEVGPMFSGISDSPQVIRQGSDDSPSRRKSDVKETAKSVDSGTTLGSAPPPGSSRNPRICYACSTATNPSCWNPDQRTTIKYCTQEQSCVTKTFGNKNSLTLIRDCAKTCKDSPIPGLEPKYKSCKLCHSDYCNSAISINGYNFAIVLIIGIVKCTYNML